MWWFLIVVIFALLWYKQKKVYSYWPERNVRQGKQILFFGDIFWSLIRWESITDMIYRLHEHFPDDRYYGMYMFTKPLLSIKDPELVKQITIRDFEHFTDHRPFFPKGLEPLWERNILALNGEKWHKMRSTLSPAFTASKMKFMFKIINECAEHYAEHYLSLDKDVIECEMKKELSRFSSDVIASCAFGIKTDTLADPQNEFYTNGLDLTDFTKFEKTMAFLAHAISERFAKWTDYRFISPKVSKFFSRLVSSNIKEREEKNIFRPDFIHLMLEAKKGTLKNDEENDEGLVKVQLEEVDIIAQALVFYFAGFDTTSTLSSFVFYELATHPDIQEKLQAEVTKVLGETDGKLTYESIAQMNYLDMIISETLRLWAPMAATDRICTKPYVIEAVLPHEKPVPIAVGDVISLPSIAIQRDPKYFPDPQKFDPERFSAENKANIVPGSYIPFGMGPRVCLGQRFALIVAKTLVANFMKNFDVVVTKKTDIPLVFDKSMFPFRAKNGVWLGFKRR